MSIYIIFLACMVCLGWYLGNVIRRLWIAWTAHEDARQQKAQLDHVMSTCSESRAVPRKRYL